MPSQLPYFIKEHLVSYANFYKSRKERTTLSLVKSLHLYETHNKQILNSLDLQKSVLSRVYHKFESIIPEQSATPSQVSDILGSSISSPAEEISFGKYVYQNREDKQLYVLLKCWDLLVVIKKSPKGLTLQAEYENVDSYKMCKSNNYQVRVIISFLHGKQNLVTNFQDNQNEHLPTPRSDAYKSTLNKVKMKQSELLVHKLITRKEFAKLKSMELFGCNFLRSPKLEEMQILSRYGDAWFKLTADDDIVVGVPLINNSSTRLTTLRNVRAVLLSCTDSDYTFELYELSRGLSDMENIQTYFKNDVTEDSCIWSRCTNLNLRPEAFCVLILRLQLNKLLQFMHAEPPLYVFYDVVISGRTFSQKFFVRTLAFQYVFSSPSSMINFDQPHLHRDLLTVMAASYEIEVRIEYTTNCATFENFLCKEMNFFQISVNQNCTETMNVDGQDQDIGTMEERTLFYNKNKNSVWHGTLLAMTHNRDLTSDVYLYTKTVGKSKMFLALLSKELEIKCGIKKICRDTRSLPTKLLRFEAALRDECYLSLEIYSYNKTRRINGDKKSKLSLQDELHLKQLKTDELFRDFKS